MVFGTQRGRSSGNVYDKETDLVRGGKGVLRVRKEEGIKLETGRKSKVKSTDMEVHRKV